MTSILKNSAIGVMMITIITFIVLPLPVFLIDFLLITNMGIAVLIFLNALYAKEALQMSMFPTLLLMTTLFRLALNVSTTRSILANGEAGQVIDTFAFFVAGGDMVIGILVFVIIIIVNFLVITKGATRIAEVTARFTLDAMPGKQMAIDADLNSGIIDEEGAKERRKKIQDESQFYGSMDGAAKFVQNDAIAGILIIFITIIGGIVMGVVREGLSIGDAAEVYTLLVIGDGLTNAIPALFISTSAGLLVSKATLESEITGTLGTQIFGSPMVLFIAGGFLLLLGSPITPLPGFILLPFGAMLIALGVFLRRNKSIAAIESEITTDDVEAEETRKPENVVSLLNVEPILVLFGYGLVPLVDSSLGGDLIERVVMIRRQIAVELGAVVPVIRLKDDIKQPPNQYSILIKGVEVANGEILFDHYMAMNSGYVEEEIDGIETVEPYMGLPALWISESQRERAEALGYTVVDPPAIIATHLTEVVRSHLHELLSRQDVQLLINNVKETHGILIDELVPKMMTIGEIQKILAKLLRESISIRDLVTILETLADYAPITRDLDMLTEYVRQNLRRAISKKFFAPGVNTVITLDPALEQTLTSNIQKTEVGSFVNIDQQLSSRIFDSLKAEVGKLTSMGLMPIILTSPFVRMYFKQLVEEIAPDLVVLSYGEIDQTAEVQSIGMVSV
ncbi:MAG: flagellar biosynthesis protein FlhA [Turicibacter sp.]|nr:flagellar biosynthesis protein FlhA [Turicibacter sp.]